MKFLQRIFTKRSPLPLLQKKFPLSGDCLPMPRASLPPKASGFAHLYPFGKKQNASPKSSHARAECVQNEPLQFKAMTNQGQSRCSPSQKRSVYWGSPLGTVYHPSFWGSWKPLWLPAIANTFCWRRHSRESVWAFSFQKQIFAISPMPRKNAEKRSWRFPVFSCPLPQRSEETTAVCLPQPRQLRRTCVCAWQTIGHWLCGRRSRAMGVMLPP